MKKIPHRRCLGCYESKPKNELYRIVKTKEGQKEFDVPYHYMMIDGERFDFPLGLTMKQFFFINNNRQTEIKQNINKKTT